jgi:hypothetical protein
MIALSVMLGRRFVALSGIPVMFGGLVVRFLRHCDLLWSTYDIQNAGGIA